MIDKSKSVLLIGSDGFLGNWFRDILDENGNKYATYDIQSGNDICGGMGDIPRYDYVINCAGIASPEKYMKQPVETMDVSYIGTKNVLDYCVDNKVESVLMFSSSEVYGTPESISIPTKEDYIGTIPTRSSRSCYDIGKQVLETLCHIYHNKHNVPVKVVRPFNFYGAYMGINDNRVLSNWMRSMLRDEDIMIYGDGKQIRDWLYVEDHCRAIELIIDKGKRGETYNIGGNNGMTNIELVILLCEIINQRFDSNPEMKQCYPNSPCSNDLRAESLITYVQDRPGHDRRYAVDISKISAELGFQPRNSFISGLNKTVDWYLENKEWWKSILNGTYRDDNLS